MAAARAGLVSSNSSPSSFFVPAGSFPFYHISVRPGCAVDPFSPHREPKAIDPYGPDPYRSGSHSHVRVSRVLPSPAEGSFVLVGVFVLLLLAGSTGYWVYLDATGRGLDRCALVGRRRLLAPAVRRRPGVDHPRNLPQSPVEALLGFRFGSSLRSNASSRRNASFASSWACSSSADRPTSSLRRSS